MITFDNSFVRDLPGCFLRLPPDRAPNPRMAVYNQELAESLGLGEMPKSAEWLSGAEVPPGADPAALAYAGHQFGGFSAQLGDGRAHLLGEFLGPDGRRWDLQLKGSGRTPFARGGDGKAALGPMLREYVISEAMAALGIPTTRSLAVVTTGEQIRRDQGLVPGAVVARVAASHIRVGSFQFYAARGETDKLEALTNYTIARHFPGAEGALGLFDAVMARQARLIAQWMGVGFVHGVMNTDNMALSGETIDYGPCAFMENYDPGTVFSSIDRQGRYAYGNQPVILGWNLARLAEALLPLIDADQDRAVDLANERLGQIEALYQQEWLAILRAKLGLPGEEAADAALANDFLAAIAGVDWTQAFYRLGGPEAAFLALFAQQGAIKDWLMRWRARGGERALVNPVVIPRNHLVEAALQAAESGDMAPFHALVAQVRRPFGEVQGREAYALAAPSGFGDYVTFCGT